MLTAAPEGSTLSGASGNDRLVGGDGPDSLTGDSGNDVLTGGAGDDELDGLTIRDRGPETERDHLLGGLGDDRLWASELDRADGGPGNDWIDGDAFSLLTGGDGDDEITSMGAIAIEGGPGADKISSRDESASARLEGMQVVDCGPGDDQVAADFTDELVGCESVRTPKPRTRLTIRPVRGGRHTQFRISFRAPFTTSGSGGRRFVVDARAAKRRCSRLGEHVAARKGERVTVILRPPRRGWCPGVLPLILFETRRSATGIAGEEDSFSIAIARARIRLR